MAPKYVDKEEKRRQILVAALSVFSQNGFNSTKISDVAMRAGIGKGTLYEYFPSKKDLFTEAFDHYWTGIENEIDNRLRQLTNPEEKLLVFVQAWFEALFRAPDLLDVIFEFWAEGIRTRHDKINLNEQYKNCRARIESILSDGVHRGFFRRMNTHHMAAVIIGAMDGMALQWALDHTTFHVKDVGMNMILSLLNGIRASQ